jgi:hypothetical protein
MLSDAVIFNRGHSPWALLVIRNHVIGVIPLLVQRTFVPVLEELGYDLSTPSKLSIMGLAQLVPCVNPALDCNTHRHKIKMENFIDR